MKCTTSIQLVLITSSLILAGCGRAPQSAAQQPCLDEKGQPRKNEKGQLLNCQGLPIQQTGHVRSHGIYPWFGGYGRSWGNSRTVSSPTRHAPSQAPTGGVSSHGTTGGTHTSHHHTGGVSRSGGFGHSSHSVHS